MLYGKLAYLGLTHYNSGTKCCADGKGPAEESVTIQKHMSPTNIAGCGKYLHMTLFSRENTCTVLFFHYLINILFLLPVVLL